MSVSERQRGSMCVSARHLGSTSVSGRQWAIFGRKRAVRRASPGSTSVNGRQWAISAENAPFDERPRASPGFDERPPGSTNVTGVRRTSPEFDARQRASTSVPRVRRTPAGVSERHLGSASLSRPAKPSGDARDRACGLSLVATRAHCRYARPVLRFASCAPWNELCRADLERELREAVTKVVGLTCRGALTHGAAG